MLTNEISMAVVRAISGEITQNFRQISFGMEEREAKFIFYTVRPPNDDDREAAEVIAVNFDSSFPQKLDAVLIEFVTSDAPFGLLNNLDFVAFRRWERP